MEQYANDFVAALASGIGAGDATMSLASAPPPPLTLGQWRARIDDEIVLVTAVAGAVCTIVRAAEAVGTVQAAAAHAAGAAVEHVFTAASLRLAALAPETFAATNKDSFAFAVGAPVATHASGSGVVRAAAADNLLNAVGLATLGAVANGAEAVQTAGLFQLSDWSAVVGAPTLSPKAVYFLGASPGTLTATPPSVNGQVVQPVGRAVAPDTLELIVGPSVIL